MDREQETLADILGVINWVGETTSQGVNKLTKHKSDKFYTEQFFLKVENEFIFANDTKVVLDTKPKFTIKNEREPVLKADKQENNKESIKENKSFYKGKNLSKMCPLCDIKLDKGKELRKHMTTIHTDFKPFICDGCGKTFKLKHHMKIHAKLHNSTSSDTNSKTLNCNIKPFICDSCGKTFKQKGQLKVHGKVHGKVHKPDSSDRECKTFPCTLCPRTVATKYILDNHMNFIHGNTKSAPCTKCGKKLKLFSVRKHEKLCGLSEKQKEEKRAREKVDCTICGKIFASGPRMRRHIRFIHNLEKCLQCKHCGYEDSRMDYMRAHIKNEHRKMDINDSIITLVEAKSS